MPRRAHFFRPVFCSRGCSGWWKQFYYWRADYSRFLPAHHYCPAATGQQAYRRAFQGRGHSTPVGIYQQSRRRVNLYSDHAAGFPGQTHDKCLFLQPLSSILAGIFDYYRMLMEGAGKTACVSHGVGNAPCPLLDMRRKWPGSLKPAETQPNGRRVLGVMPVTVCNKLSSQTPGSACTTIPTPQQRGLPGTAEQFNGTAWR